MSPRPREGESLNDELRRHVEHADREFPAINALERLMPEKLVGMAFVAAFAFGLIARWARDTGHADAFRAYCEAMAEHTLSVR